MVKKIIIAIISVFILWSIIDFVIHGIILTDAYEATAKLWRPMEEMKMGLMRIVVLISSIVFVLIYAIFFSEQNIKSGLKYGTLFGIGAGISMGYGSYAVMPVPYSMAFTWFVGVVIEAALGGLLIGVIIKNKA
ncbi:MAG: hypothetical protein MRK02_06325 [Candidatus Scalindua sp.]|nr:hypothetical protein [Candidatus Scalindua sp.]